MDKASEARASTWPEKGRIIRQCFYNSLCRQEGVDQLSFQNTIEAKANLIKSDIFSLQHLILP